MAKTNLIVDMSNLMWSSHHGAKNTDGFSKGLLIHSFLTSLRYVADKFNADGILIACDSQNVWRRDLYPEYKGNRAANRDENYQEVLAVMEELRNFLNTATSIPAVGVERSEADDVIAVACQYVRETSPDTKLVIVSGDRDFVQLLDNNTRLYSPVQRAERTSDDPEYDLFVKCIRGDMGDNITSAYPRVRSTKLEKAYVNKVEMVNLMETVTKDGIHVGQLYTRNRELIDLTRQPQEVKEAIRGAVSGAINDGGKYNYVKALRFLGEHDLKNIIDDIDGYRALFMRGFVLA